MAVVSDSRRSPAADPSRVQPSVGLHAIDVDSGDPKGPRQQVPGAKGHDWDNRNDPADRLRISPDGRTLVSVLEGQVRIWHRRGQRWVGPQSVPIPGLARDDAARTVLVGATFSAAGDRAAVVFARVASPTVWEPAGVVIDLTRAHIIGPASLASPGNGLSHMAISPDGTTLLIGDSEGPVRVRRVADDQVLHTIPGQSPVTVVAWSPKGRRFAIGRLDGTTEVYSLNPLQGVMITSGSDWVSVLAFVGEHGLMRESITGSIARYDLDALSPVATQVATAPIHALDAAAGLIAQGEDNGRVTIRDGRTLRQIGEKLTLGPYRSRDRGPGMAAGRQITALALTPNGSAIIAADQVGHLRMWSLPGRELLWSRDDVPTSWLAVSADGRYLATVGNTYEGGVPDGAPVTSTVTVWNLSTHAVHLSKDLTGKPVPGARYRPHRTDHADAQGRGVLARREQGCSRKQRLPRLREDLRPGAAATALAADDVQQPPVLGGLLTRQPATPGRQPGHSLGMGCNHRGGAEPLVDTGPARLHQNDLHRGRSVAG